MIYYLAPYADARESPDRDIVSSATRKIRYIVSRIKQLDYDVSIISTAPLKAGYRHSEFNKFIFDEHESHIYLEGIAVRIPVLSSLFFAREIKRYLSDTLLPDDVVIAYHSPMLLTLYSWLSSRANCFILELNDRYSLHYKNRLKSYIISQAEKRSVKCAKRFILASEWLEEYVPKGSKCIVNYGDTSVSGKNVEARGSNAAYRVVYAGVIERLRNAAFIVAMSAAMLPSDIEVYIAGFGKSDAVEELNNLIDRQNRNSSHAKVNYLGKLEGSALDELLDACDVGVNAHSYSEGDEWQAKYSFPSKIPLYCGHGLPVITCCEEIFRSCQYGECLRFFKSGDPGSLAASVLSLREEGELEVDPREVAREVDGKFMNDLEGLLLTSGS